MTFEEIEQKLNDVESRLTAVEAVLVQFLVESPTPQGSPPSPNPDVSPQVLEAPPVQAPRVSVPHNVFLKKPHPVLEKIRLDPGDKVLLKSQFNPEENGVYTVNPDLTLTKD